MAEITAVVPGSPAERAGVQKGDWLLELNGHPIADVLDYQFYATEEKLTLKLHRGEKILEISLCKGEYEDLGLEFATYLMDEKRSCRNKCVFCFIDQLPKGMRDTLYFKDDDSRLSFLQGNYVTLTNMKDEDLQRIVQMHITPVNVSVHTTNGDLRVKMMKNRFAGEILRQMKLLARGGVQMNCQIVLCKGLNDGATHHEGFRSPVSGGGKRFRGACRHDLPPGGALSLRAFFSRRMQRDHFPSGAVCRRMPEKTRGRAGVLRR